MSEYSPILPLTTNSVHLLITEVGPWKGAAFGGIVAIKVFGCYADTNYEPESTRISHSEEEQPTELDWYDYESYESYDEPTDKTDTQHLDEEEDDIFSSYESEDYQESSDQLNHERHTDEDWDLFGSFGSGNKLQRGGRISVRKEENQRGREVKSIMKSPDMFDDDVSIYNDDVARDAKKEERLEKSNWPMFDSISVDAEYDESIVEKSEENPGNKQTTLYIIRRVLFRQTVKVTVTVTF